MKKYLFITLLFLLLPAMALGQDFPDTYNRLPSGTNSRRHGFSDPDDDEMGTTNVFGTHKKGDKKKDDIPTGLRVWETDSRFGGVDSVQIDTFSHHFQNVNFTEGIFGQYNTLGNMGSPRLSRLFADRSTDMSYFIFADPYDFFITPFNRLHFTNTKSPFTNISYHETLSGDNGEDRIRAIYAINAGKDIGFGLKLDYLYGRGYYGYQSTSDFNATLFGSILKEQYKAHFAFFSNYLKTAENGGIEDDEYVTNPENFPQKYGTKDIPTRLSKVWNKMHVDGLQWTHRYSVGFRRVIHVPDSAAAADAPAPASSGGDSVLAAIQNRLAAQAGKGSNDSLTALADTSKTKGLKTEFVPVTSFLHSLRIEDNSRRFLANEDLSDFYLNRFFEGDSTLDKIHHTRISNLLGVELHEGFNKWAMAGIRLYAQHDYHSYELPAGYRLFEKFSENRITLGGQIFKQRGRNINYTLEAETSSDGDSWGDFRLRGEGLLKVRFLGDSLRLKVHGSVTAQKPTFFYRTYHSKWLWWDHDDLDKQLTTRLGATFSSEKTRTRLKVDLQNVEKYTYFATTANLMKSQSGDYYLYDTDVRQSSSNLQLVSATLCQDFTLGPLNWESQVTYQTSTDEEVMPLPKLSLYSNLYLLFRIAKVLRVELGGDVRYFTSYYAPTYSPALGMYANQPEAERIEVGNYPIVDVYANLHLKHTRFYFMASHVNYSKGSSGCQFLVPHYPVNPFVIRLGLSWNFFN